jgi:hypothetical protein
MSISVLAGDITIYFTNDTGGDKQIRWTGSAANTATRTVNEVYSAVIDVFDNVAVGAGEFMDEGIPFRAVTPTSYLIGQIETNDNEPWFIDDLTIEHLTGGAITTIGWTRTPGSIIGVVKVAVTSNNWTASDIVSTATENTNGDTGIILYVGTTEVWIRPTTNAAANNFDTGSGTITSAGPGTTVTYAAASTTGEREWVNLFTIGTIVSGTQVYVAQDQTVLSTFWPVGPVDRLFLTQDESTIIDNGYLTIYARRETDLYDNFITDASAGGRIAIPLTTGDDLNNLTNLTTLAGSSITFGGVTADINADATLEDYSIQINAGANSLRDTYRFLQFITRRGSVTSINGLEGQQYTGIDYRVEITSVTGTINAGNELTGSVSGATGYVAHVNTAPVSGNNYAMLHNSQGTFVVGENLTIGGNSLNNLTAVVPITPSKAAPFGTFAGGQYFLARGVVITNTTGSTYQTTDDLGDPYSPPLTRTFALTGIAAGSEVRILSNAITTTKDIELFGVETSGTTEFFQYTISGSDITYTRNFGDITDGKIFNLTAPTSITIIVFDLNFKEVRLTLNVTGVDQSIPIQQIVERNYLSGSV